MADADVHSTPPGPHNRCHPPLQKQTGHQFPPGNGPTLTVLGKAVLGGQGGRTALRASSGSTCGPCFWREMLVLFSPLINSMASLPRLLRPRVAGGEVSGEPGTAHRSTLQTKAGCATWKPALMSSGWLTIICWSKPKHRSPTRPTKQFSPEIITTSFNLHLQKPSAKLISGLFQWQHTYDTHFCRNLSPASLLSPTPASNMATGTNQQSFSRGHRKGFILVSPNAGPPSWAGAVPVGLWGWSSPVLDELRISAPKGYQMSFYL